MSLVAYDNSDCDSDGSDSEENQVPAPTAGCSLAPAKIMQQADEKGAVGLEPSAGKKRGITRETSASLFSLLPAPKRPAGPVIISEDDPVPMKVLKKETVKIRIPSLKEFEEDDEEEEKSKMKRKPSKTGSGLMSLLPEPQKFSTKSTPKLLVPHSVSSKVKPPPKPLSKPALPVVSVSPPANCTQDGHTSDEEPVTDFFSLTATTDKDIPTLPNISPNNFRPALRLPDPKVVNNPEPPFEQEYRPYARTATPGSGGDVEFANNEGSSSNWTSVNSFEAPYYESNNYASVDTQIPQWENQGPSNSQVPAPLNHALLRLAGKKQSNQENIDLVDVNADDLTAGREEWLLKSLSEVHSHQPSAKRSDQPSAMHRRKHQITYLAFQAKAREQELKNQWSMNRMTKKQTQSKYGF